MGGKPTGGLGSLEPNISRGMGNAGLAGIKRPAPVNPDEPFVKRMRHQEGAPPPNLFRGRSFQQPPPMGAQPVNSGGFPKTAAVRPGPMDPMSVSPPPPRPRLNPQEQQRMARNLLEGRRSSI